METASYAPLLHSKSIDELEDSGPKEDIELGLSVSGGIEINKKIEEERGSPGPEINKKVEEEIDSPLQDITPKKIEEEGDSPVQDTTTPRTVAITPRKKTTDDLSLKEIKIEKNEPERSRNESKVSQLCPMGLTCPLLHDDDHIKEYSHPDLLKLKKYLEDLKAQKEGKTSEEEDKNLNKLRDEVAFSRRSPSMLPSNFSPSLLYAELGDSPRGQDRKLTQERPSLQSSLHSEIFEWMRKNKIYERLLVPTSLNCPDMDLSLIVPGIFFEIIVLACRQAKIKEDDAKKIVSSAIGKFPDFEEIAIARKMGKVLEKLEREVKTVSAKVQTIVLERIAIIEQTKSKKTFACNRQFTFELFIQIIFVTLSALFGIISLTLYLTAPHEIKIISVLEAVTPLVFGVSLIFFYFISPIIREDETYQKKILRNILEIHWYGDQLATWVGPTYNVPTDKKIPFIFFVNPKKWCNRNTFSKYKYQLKREEKIRVNIPPNTELIFSRKDNLGKQESKRSLASGEEEPKLMRQNAKMDQGDDELPALTRQAKAKITRQISDYGAMTQVVSNLEKCKKNIVSLSFKNCYLDDDDIAILEPFLTNNPNLTNLDLEHNNIRSLGAQTLAKVISANSSLEYLNLNYNSISTPGAKALADALAKNKKTHIWIDLQHNSKITEYDYIFSILATKSALAEQSLLIQLESMSKEDKRRIAWVFFIITITLLHCLAPGMTRIVQGSRFIGTDWFEKFIAIGHIITGSLCVPGLCLYIRGINNDLRDLEFRMVRIGAVMSQRKAQLLNQYKNQNSSQRWNWSMDLSTGKQLDFWLQLRDYTRRRDQTDTNLVVGALLTLDLILLFAIFGRVVILGRAGDVFNILGLLDALSLAVVLTIILSHIVTINTEITEHREELASIRYHYALKCSNKPDNLTKLQKSKYQRISELVTLYDSAIYKLVNHDRPVRILGIGVDRDLVIKLVSVMVTIGVSGLGTLINAIQRSLRS